MSEKPDAPVTQLDEFADRRLAAWIEENLSCKITAFERQKRWRPGWYVDTWTSAGEHQSLYVRGHRPERDDDAPFYREYKVLKVLEAEGIPVPHIYGLCPDPLAMVQDRAAGRPDLSTAESDEERACVLNQYMEVLARVHQIDPGKFEGIGLEPCDGPREIVVGHFNRFVAEYRRSKRRPEPVMEFLIGWVQRNTPLHRTKVSFLVSDVAQFMFDDGKLTALLDLELACLGDSLQDLAAFQFRNTSEPLGDFASALRHYQEITGEPIDADVFDLHAIAFASITPLGMTSRVSRSMPTSSVLQYLEWWVHGSRWPLEIIAARSNVVLPQPEPLPPEPTPYDPLSESLVGAINALPADGEFATYERGATANLAAFVARTTQYGPPIYRQDKAEVEAFLGGQFDSLEEADAALEAFVLAADAEEDARLLPILYSRVQRHCELFRPFLSRPSVENRMKTFAQLMAT
jgi:aminoglycoside phosphotransferase (APT) family kinase protein